MSEGESLSSPCHTVTEMRENHAEVSAGIAVDPRVRFSTRAREESSLYGTPKEEMMPNVNSSRYCFYFPPVWPSF